MNFYELFINGLTAMEIPLMILIIVMTIDVVMGILAAIISKTFSHTILTDGLIRKMMILLVIVASGAISYILFQNTTVLFTVLTGMTIIQFLSIIKKVRNHIELPKELHSLISKLEEEQHAEDEEGADKHENL
ncbi:phage holin family protein [Culicoidibacter larvae]|uniref:Phage holin family protein n=1 Tax=Culicoidibacter larvae TaxID=2579976 RepID=A0A5R8QE72_9FIRM|nr:phage holin family protein [Culicoidibacter larvae]TLG75252.1 phage holin family protein [Culicoidibacter larvae]